jgi:bifunctional non-homologous end joining protein LigD
MAGDAMVDIEGRQVKLTNLEKVLYPENGFTKGEVIDYYARIAPVLLPHVKDHPLTLHRFPNGVEEKGFYEKNATKHRPEWIKTVDVPVTTKTLNQILATETATLVFTANLASLEVHPLLAKYKDLERPTKITFDLDPGAPAGIISCCEVALELRDVFEQFDLQSFPKTSGSKGMQIDVPINSKVDYTQTKPFAHAIARLLASRMPKLVVSEMEKAIRKNKVFIDWSQNDRNKTTIAPYSLRARRLPWVSTPITWEEVESARKEADLQFETKDALARVDKMGDLHADVITLKQRLPKFEQ